MVKSVKVLVDGDSHNAYRSGSIVSGRVLVEVETPTKFRQIKVTISGRAEVGWDDEGIFGGFNRHLFLNVTKTVWKSRDTVDGKLSPNVHSFPFQFLLPSNTPSSFQSPYGQVHYTILGKVVGGLLKEDYSGQTEIAVQQVINVNRDSLLTSRRFKQRKHDGFLCFGSGSAKFVFSLQRTGFVTGESIPIDVEIKNRMTSDVQLTASILRLDIYRSRTGRKKRVDQVINTISSPEIQSQASPTNWNTDLLIPANSLLTMTNCSCIFVHYFFKMTMGKAPQPQPDDVCVQIPIVIGNAHVPSQPTQVVMSLPATAASGAAIHTGSYTPTPTSSYQTTITGPHVSQQQPPPIAGQISTQPLSYGASAMAGPVPYGSGAPSVQPPGSSSYAGGVIPRQQVSYAVRPTSQNEQQPPAAYGTFPRLPRSAGATHTSIAARPMSLVSTGPAHDQSSFHKAESESSGNVLPSFTGHLPRQHSYTYGEAAPLEAKPLGPPEPVEPSAPPRHTAGIPATHELSIIYEGDRFVANTEPTAPPRPTTDLPPSYDDVITGRAV